MRTSRRSLLALAALLAIGAAAHAQTSYLFVDLGAGNEARINNAGQIAGSNILLTPQDNNNDGVPDNWISSILPLPSGYTLMHAYGINDLGQVAGQGFASNTSNWRALFTSVSEPPAALTSRVGSAYGINDNTVLAGYAYDSKGNHFAATWKKVVTNRGTSWTQTSLGIPGGLAASWAWDINNAGAVVAHANNTSQSVINAYVWLPGALYGFSSGGWKMLPQGSTGARPVAINERGQIAGQVGNRAGLWMLSGGAASLQDIHSPSDPTWTGSSARDLDNAADSVIRVVGDAYGTGANRAFLWRSDTQQMIDLNTVATGVPAGQVLNSATGINDLGWIVGTSQLPGAPTRRWVLIPQ